MVHTPWTPPPSTPSSVGKAQADARASDGPGLGNPVILAQLEHDLGIRRLPLQRCEVLRLLREEFLHSRRHDDAHCPHRFVGVSDPKPPKRAEWYQAAVNAADPEQALAAFVSGIVTILDRSAPLAPVLASAATLEPMIAEHLGHTEQLRVDGYLAFIRHLHRNGLLRPGLSVEVATDVLLTLLGPATYVAFTRGRAWSHSQYLRWITPALLELLIKDRRSS